MAFSPARGGGLEDDLDSTTNAPYRPAQLPLSSKAARTWLVLHETKITTLPDETPFRDVLQALRKAVRDPKSGEPRLKFHIPWIRRLRTADRIDLDDREVPNPFLEPEKVSLQTYLELSLKSLGLVHYVHDDFVIIDDEVPEDEIIRPTVSAAEARTWLQLHEEITLNFLVETPLADALRTVRRASTGKGTDGRGLLIYVDPAGLQEAEATLTSPVKIELGRVPLGTAMGLFLKPLGLGFRVRDDGILFITRRAIDDEGDCLMDEAEVADAYRSAHYQRFRERNQGQKGQAESPNAIEGPVTPVPVPVNPPVPVPRTRIENGIDRKQGPSL